MGTTGTAASRPMRADARRNWEALVAQAAEAFAERGADDVSLEEIARRAGVGIGTLYRHFPSRQSLLEAVFRDQVEALARRADDLLPAADPGSAFIEWLSAMIAFGATKRSMLAGLLASDVPAYTECMSLVHESTSALLRRAQQAGAVRPDVTDADVKRVIHALVVANEHAPADPGQPDRMLSLMAGGLLTRDQAG